MLAGDAPGTDVDPEPLPPKAAAVPDDDEEDVLEATHVALLQ